MQKTITKNNNVTREDAEKAIATTLQWLGEDINRDGLLGTPSRILRAYEEFFSGYRDEPQDYLKKTFEETGEYDEMVVLRDIPFISHCEHHMLPIIGTVNIAYIPRDRVVGISKLVRVVHSYAKRLQIQEKMTTQIMEVIRNTLRPHGVAVSIKAEHQCMSIRGVKTGRSSSMVTLKLNGVFKKDYALRAEFMSLSSSKV